MDPDATWATINDDTLDNEDRARAALDMFEWLLTGGYLPTVKYKRPNTIGARNKVIDTCREVIEKMIDRPTPLDMRRYV